MVANGNVLLFSRLLSFGYPIHEENILESADRAELGGLSRLGEFHNNIQILW